MLSGKLHENIKNKTEKLAGKRWLKETFVQFRNLCQEDAIYISSHSRKKKQVQEVRLKFMNTVIQFLVSSSILECVCAIHSFREFLARTANPL